jgi:transposase InsO family protein
MYQNLK